VKQVTVITGSTRGIGAAIARRMAPEARLVVNGRNAETGQAFAESLCALGSDVVFRPGSVLDISEMATLMDGVREEIGPVNILVTSGAASDGPMAGFFREADPSCYVDWALHIWASRLYAVKAVLPQMVEAGGGSIVLLSSDAGRWPTPGESIPGGAAAALHMTARTLSREFSRWKIRINVVSTTVVTDSPGGERSTRESPAAKVFAKAVARQAFPLTSDDVAEAVAFLASERARSITGQILSVNGGVSVGL
jgi:2-hydroxycyclohexanecarboxyl-CoA dehydrogenase